jgi:rod shape-determining protein MreC
MTPPIQIASPKRSKARPRGIFLVISVILGGIMLLDLSAPHIGAALRSAILAAATPPVTVIDTMNRSMQSAAMSVQGVLTAPRRIATLEAEVSRLKAVDLSAQALEQENRQLRRALKVVPPAPLTFVTAQIMPGRNGIWHLRFKGNAVTHGMAAVRDNHLIGRVWKAERETAMLLPLSDPRSRVPVTAGRSGVDLILAGTGDTQHLAIRYSENLKALLPGEALYTSATGNLFPVGIPVATVAHDDRGKPYAIPLGTLDHGGWVQLIRL